MEEDKRKYNGGNKNAGRKSKADEEKVNTIFSTALKQLYSKDNDVDAKIEFTKTLLESQRGQIFIAEHLFGKPKETIDQNVTIDNFSLKDVISFDKS
jgi:hypothetical protein